MELHLIALTQFLEDLLTQIYTDAQVLDHAINKMLMHHAVGAQIGIKKVSTFLTPDTLKYARITI